MAHTNNEELTVAISHTRIAVAVNVLKKMGYTPDNEDYL